MRWNRASAALKDDREIVLEAVKQDGRALEYASAALKDDREIVLEAVKAELALYKDDLAIVQLKYASAALKDDREIVLGDYTNHYQQSSVREWHCATLFLVPGVFIACAGILELR